MISFYFFFCEKCYIIGIKEWRKRLGLWGFLFVLIFKNLGIIMCNRKFYKIEYEKNKVIFL